MIQVGMAESSLCKGELQMRFVPSHKNYFHHLATYSFEVDGREGITNPTVHFGFGGHRGFGGPGNAPANGTAPAKPTN
jgi:hypothetical protein